MRTSKLFTYLLSFIFSFGNVWGKIENLRICVVGNPRLRSSHTTKYCDLLGKSKRSPVSCTYEIDRVACMQAISSRKADFAVLDPEDLYYTTLMEDSPILVVSEIKALKENSFKYGTVVVVRRTGNVTGFKDLMGKNLCHPGTETGPEWPYMFSQYFEERVAPSNCEEGLTLYEDRIKTTSKFFASACKAGPWVVNATEDIRLKTKYWNLCAICESGKCQISEKYRGSGGSIACFKDGAGDVLWARYEDVKLHLIKGADESASDYMLLCDDGSLRPVTAADPCIWLARPWQVVAANRKSANSVQKIVESLSDEKNSQWEENLLHVIELYLHYIQNLVVARTPEDYLRNVPGYLSASSMSEGNCKPKHFVKLCVSSTLEHIKCTTMSKAAFALSIQPDLKCIQKANVSSCLNSVAEMESDAVVVPPDFLYDALLKFQLKTLLLESGSAFNDSHLVSAVVRKNSKIKSLSDMRNTKVCLTRRHGIGWISAEAALQVRLPHFFNSICTADREQPEGKVLPTCCPTLEPLDDGRNVNLLKCLDQGGCDVAFVDSSTLKEANSGYRVICSGPEAGPECVWMWSYQSYLMISPRMAKPKEQEAFTIFFQLGQFFGRNSRRNNPMLKIFGPFYQVNNTLFKDSSSAFVADWSHWNHSNNYIKFLETLKSQVSHSTRFLPESRQLFCLLISFLFKWLLI